MPTRPPAVAGQFYDARPEALERSVRSYLGWPAEALSASARSHDRAEARRGTLRSPEPPGRHALGAIVPHAGYVYSGPVAGAVYARLDVAPTAIILCPNHTGRGAPAALDPSDSWQTPLGAVPLDRPLAQRLLALAPGIKEDASAHRREHSLEVQLPVLQVLRPDVRLVPICLGSPDLELCREVGEAVAQVLSGDQPPLVLASSDMNHYESREVGRRKDDMALERIEALDPEGLFATVISRSISMCGFLPATALLFAARSAGATRARVVARRDSGDETGDTSSVVGYAGVIVT